MKMDYSVRALVDLALQGDDPVQASEIAARQGIPRQYLDQLLNTLSKVGFVRSRRGPQGGHMLAHHPQEITLQRVMVALEGPAALLDCMDVPNDCSLSGACAQRNVWRSVEDAVQGVLSSITVADLASQQRNMVSQIAHQVVVAV